MRCDWIRCALAAAALCAAAAGCARSPGQAPAAESKPAGPAASPVSLRTVDATALAAAVAGHRGKVVLVDYWATWCEPCKELFPHTVALHRELAARGLAVLSVSFDESEDEPEVLKFLTAQGAAFENFRAQSGASSRSAVEFGIENGALPFMQLYDRAGTVRKTFLSPFNAEQVEKAVRELLAAPASAT